MCIKDKSGNFLWWLRILFITHAHACAHTNATLVLQAGLSDTTITVIILLFIILSHIHYAAMKNDYYYHTNHDKMLLMHTSMFVLVVGVRAVVLNFVVVCGIIIM